MHESGLAERLVGAAIEAAPGAARITSIEVSAGAIAVPSAEALEFHVGIAAAGTRAEGATLVLTPDDDPVAVRLLAVTVADETAARATDDRPGAADDQASRA